MQSYGVSWPQQKTHKASGPLSGQVFVITGSLDSVSREEAANLLRELGANVTSSLSKKTDALIVGDKPGSKKVKAEKLGTNILYEKDFLQLIKRSG